MLGTHDIVNITNSRTSSGYNCCKALHQTEPDCLHITLVAQSVVAMT